MYEGLLKPFDPAVQQYAPVPGGYNRTPSPDELFGDVTFEKHKKFEGMVRENPKLKRTPRKEDLEKFLSTLKKNPDLENKIVDILGKRSVSDRIMGTILKGGKFLGKTVGNVVSMGNPMGVMSEILMNPINVGDSSFSGRGMEMDYFNMDNGPVTREPKDKINTADLPLPLMSPVQPDKTDFN